MFVSLWYAVRMLVDDLQSAVNIHVGDVTSASCVSGLEDLVAMRAALDRLEASWILAVGAADARGDLDAGSLNATEFLALHCRRSMREARSMLRFAKRLSYTDLVREGFVNGELSAAQAQVFVHGLTKKHAALFGEHEPMLVASAANLNLAQLEQLMAHWHRRADDDLADTEDRCAEAAREVFLSPIGNSWALKGTLTPEQGSVVHQALTAVMQHEWEGNDDERTVAQRRSDALESICRRMLNTNPDTNKAPTSHGARPHVEVHIHLEDLVALASATTTKAKQRFGGYTPEGMWLSGVTVERLCCDAVINQVVITSEGPVHSGRTSRTIPAHRRRQVIARDQHCRYPGCHRPAAWSEIHHIRYWERGGTHELNNLILLCVRHHHRVHKHCETLVLHDDGRLDVTSLDGATRTTHPPPRLKQVLRQRARTKHHRVNTRVREQENAANFEHAIARLFNTETPTDTKQTDVKRNDESHVESTLETQTRILCERLLGTTPHKLHMKRAAFDLVDTVTSQYVEVDLSSCT